MRVIGTRTAWMLGIALLVVTLGARADLIRKEPYLIWPGDPTRMEVVWQLSATGPSTLEWGTDTTYALGSVQTAEYGTDHQHAFTIPDLAPGARYYYRVRADGPAYTGSFHAAPPASDADLTLLVYGDTRSNPSTHDALARTMVANWDADSTSQTLTLVVGDLVYHGDLEADWTDQFFSPTYANIRALLANAPYQADIGNHEGGGVLFMKYFPYPFVGGRYWSFDYGPIHVTMIDQYTSYAPGSPQLQWIEHDLATSTKRWKFILLHEPGWSAGGGHENNTSVQSYLQPLCVRYGVAVVFGGHNHYYARAEVNGVEHVTTGGGGAPLHTPNPTYPYIVASARANHYCRVSIHGDQLTLDAVSTQGQVLDHLTLAAPAEVTSNDSRVVYGRALPNPFSSAATLFWRGPVAPGARLRILDPAGRQVRTLALGAGAGPGHTTRWDGTDERGRRVDSGLYYFLPEPSVAGAPPGKLLLVR